MSNSLDTLQAALEAALGSRIQHLQLALGELTLTVKAINLNRRQSNFIDSVTHELKSPIASLKLYLQTLHRHSLTPEQREVIAPFLAIGEKLGSLAGVPRIRAVSTATPTYPQTILELPDFATDSSAVVAPPLREKLIWSPRFTASAAHAWLRSRLAEVAAAI